MGGTLDSTHPWNFGYYPSELVEDIDLKFLTCDDIDEADRLFELTLQCYSPRHVTKRHNQRLRELAFGTHGAEVLLSATRCKPGGLVSITERRRPKHSFTEVDLFYDLCLRRKKDVQCFTVSSLDSILIEMKKIVPAYFDKNKMNSQYHFHLGILLGYPLGDVFGFTRMSGPGKLYAGQEFSKWKTKHNYAFGYEYLIHVPTPTHWPKKWKKNVGIEAEEWLDSTYKFWCEVR